MIETVELRRGLAVAIPEGEQEDLRALIWQYNRERAIYDGLRSQVASVSMAFPVDPEPIWYRQIPEGQRMAAFEASSGAVRKAMDTIGRLRARMEACDLNLRSLEEQIGKLTEMNIREERIDA